jgi:ubiquinone/menaquinone biosynthesis C-methylase UbiE
MLEKAAVKATYRPDADIELCQADISNLPFEAAQFDAVVGSFIFMLVPEPLRTLQEIKRVCKPGGKLLLLEFTRSGNRLKAFFQDLATYLTLAVYCARVNRDIVRLVENGGFQIITVEEMASDIAVIIEATPS